MKVSYASSPSANTPLPGNFRWSTQAEPHKTRRKLILESHPEVKDLIGHEPLTKYVVAALLAAQISLGVAMRHTPFWSAWMWGPAYILGATMTHALFLALHEVSHMLAFQKIVYNRAFTLLINLPIIVPCAAAFRMYHMDHHAQQGVHGVDTDVPTETEARLLRGVWGKLFFCTNQMLFYALRPMFIRPKPWTRWHSWNVALQGAFVAGVVAHWGWGPIRFWLLSTYLAGSLHPCAGHFIAEHYTFGSTETYSYYGPLNMLCFNVGYHNEHHDFPTIPWTRLPRLKALAPECYDTLPCHTSWIAVLWNFITSPHMSLQSRTKRMPPPPSS